MAAAVPPCGRLPSPAVVAPAAPAGSGGGTTTAPSGNQNGAEGDQINASKNEEDAG